MIFVKCHTVSKNNTYICNLSKINTQCQKYFDSLVSSSFISKEHEPIPVHVEGEEGSANMIILKQALNCGKAKASKQVV